MVVYITIINQLLRNLRPFCRLLLFFFFKKRRNCLTAWSVCTTLCVAQATHSLLKGKTFKWDISVVRKKNEWMEMIELCIIYLASGPEFPSSTRDIVVESEEYFIRVRPDLLSLRNATSADYIRSSEGK